VDGWAIRGWLVHAKRKNQLEHIIREARYHAHMDGILSILDKGTISINMTLLSWINKVLLVNSWEILTTNFLGGDCSMALKGIS